MKPTPGDLFFLSDKDPIVHALVMQWRNGTLTWEEMLLQAVVTLHHQKAKIQEELTRFYWEKPPPVIILKEEDK